MGMSGPQHRFKPAAQTAVKTINLALQGGGAHGAFAWGVLDRLIEDERIGIDGISATSAGAMNAVVMAYGWTKGGRQEARRSLADFWQRVGDAAAMGLLQPSWFDQLLAQDWMRFSPGLIFFDLVTRLFSPYEFNPLNINPLRELVSASVDFAALRTANCPIKLFLCATNVRTGKIKIFERQELCIDRVMASACLPLLFQAVEVDGEHYWDGGYMGNPAIFPLIYQCTSRDIVVVHINPLHRKDLPRTAPEILNRMGEITFNSSLMREMRAISFVTELIDSGGITNQSLRRMLLHGIAADDEFSKLSPASKLNADRRFLLSLRDAGRRCADDWLGRNFSQLGEQSTVDLKQQYF
jgi:NTE family protein